MIAEAQNNHRFIRKTQLGPNEYRKNFQQIDTEIIAVITSEEADQITPLMSKIYLRLVNAPANYREREGVLRFEAEWREGKRLKAWAVLCQVVGAASATASKALSWMHDQGIIGYFSGKNGVGLRIFLNRAASSIGTQSGSGAKKILEFSPASSVERHGSENEPAFNDSFAVLENLDSDLNPLAPKNGAETNLVDKKTSEPTPPATDVSQSITERKGREVETVETNESRMASIDEIVRRLRRELEPSLKTAAVQAAAREHERTRDWLEKRGLPKAARVAQREAYNVLRSHGVISASTVRARVELEVGRSQYRPEAKPLSTEEIKELAEMCVAMLETHGQAIDVTLSAISAEAGGCLVAEDVPRVRELAFSLVQALNRKE